MSSAPYAQENKINFDKSEVFEIKNNEKNIKLKIYYNEKIIFFEIEEDDIFPKKEFNLYQSLDELIGIDKYFRQFDNLKEVFDSIKIIISNKNLSIIKEKKSMKIKIDNILSNKVFYINIPLKEKDIKSVIDSLVFYVVSHNDKINNLECQIKNLKNRTKTSRRNK